MNTNPPTIEAKLDRLKEILQGIKPGDFEKVAAALMSELLGVAIAVAKSGFQHGGDAGPAGRQDRRFRIETKRYGDSTSLSDRELLGEIDHALNRDPALEAWFLIATRAAPEQLEQDLLSKSDKLGLPVVIIDWKADRFPALAALCTVAPEVLETLVSPEAAQLARDLASDGNGSLDRLRQDLEVWTLGFDRLRALGAAKLAAIWTSPRVSVAALGQNAAGGASPTTIKRERVNIELDRWWTGRAAQDAPAAVVGWQGSGKTWASLQWAMDNLDEQPLVLVVPSSAVAGLGPVSKPGLKRFIGERIYDLTESRDGSHWQLRFDRLLKRPAEEGPVLTLILDGMNQEPAAPWLDLLKVLQDPEFSGRIRTIAITRNLHFEDRLAKLRALFIPPEVIEVGIYDDADGGELDQRLAAEGLSRADLHADLIEIARTPRLFNLVVRLRERLAGADQITIHRLLWEYGRDTLALRDGAPFSEADWRVWLTEIAQHRLSGISSYSLGELGQMISRPDLSRSEVFRRLSEIVDGEFTKQGAAGRFTLSPVLVAHALGAALIEHMVQSAPADRDSAEQVLADWLDPIAGLDEKAEILRAAVSILLESDATAHSHILSTILFEWMRSQNLPEQHRIELVRIAGELCMPLLDVVERSSEASLGTARVLAVNALRAISRDDAAAQEQIVARCQAWLNIISRDVDPPSRRNADSEKARAARLVERVGLDADGERTILGQPVIFIERQHRDLESTIPELLEGFPLLPSLRVFEAAALAMAVRHRQDIWDVLKWLCLLNERDFVATATALRIRARAIASLAPEQGVHAELGKRVGALLLWLSGDEDNEAEAVRLNPTLDRNYDYQRDYLDKPGTSFFTLEMRHAAQVLSDPSIPLRRRIERAERFLLDPTFEPPPLFCMQLRAAMAEFEMDALDTNLSHTDEDNTWEAVTPALARCAPDLLAALVRRKLHGFAMRSADQRYFAGIRSHAHYLLVDPAAAEAAQTLRNASRCPGEDEETIVSGNLLVLEIASLPAIDQVVRVIEADLKKGIDRDIGDVLYPLTRDDVDVLIARFGSEAGKQRDDLVIILFLAPVALSETAWEWLIRLALDSDFRHRGVAAKLLHAIDPVRFGRLLLQEKWQWGPNEDLWSNHYGSLALAEASIGLPFDQHVSAIAPWLILRAVTIRGGSPADVETAVAVIGAIFTASPLETPDLGSDIFVHDDARAEDPGAISVSVRPDPALDPFEQFRDAMDSTKQLEARRRAVETAVERIKQARASGASMYLHNLRADDFAAAIAHAPQVVEDWLEGHEAPTHAFKNRVRLAEGFYLALCEALLATGTELGERTWYALRASITARHIARGGVERLTLMVFRTADAREHLWRELFDLSYANSDMALFDLALAAALTDRNDLLRQVMTEDEASGVVWRQQRAMKLRGYSAGNRLPLPQTWPEGPTLSLREDRERDIRAWKRSEAFARHWCDRYWNAETTEEAYAAWELVLRCVDRRAYVWLEDRPEGFDATIEASRNRYVHARLNHDAFKRATERPEKKLNEHFLGRKCVEGIGPWREISMDD